MSPTQNVLWMILFIEFLFMFLIVTSCPIVFLLCRKFLAKLFNSSSDNLYSPKRKWTLAAREHLNNSLGEAGLKRQLLQSKPVSFLSHPIPEYSCTTIKPIGNYHECPKWLKDSVGKSSTQQTTTANENEQKGRVSVGFRI